MKRIAFHELPFLARLAAVLVLFNTWVIIAEFVIDRYGIDEHLPFYRFGDVCLYEVAVIIALIVLFVRKSRVPKAASAAGPPGGAA